jgi:hypothetical protein
MACGLSLPGGDESELVNGVRACSDLDWPERDMIERVGAMEPVECIALHEATRQQLVRTPRIVLGECN